MVHNHSHYKYLNYSKVIGFLEQHIETIIPITVQKMLLSSQSYPEISKCVSDTYCRFKHNENQITLGLTFLWR